MNSDTREPQAPESYATFWQPLPADAPAPAPTPVADTPADAKDAYLEFVNVTEGVGGANRADRS
jgi:hypothetical protein